MSVPPKPRRKPGRPSKFTPALAAAICERLAEGESLRSICVGESMPERRSVLRWLIADAEFCRLYARARELGADVIAETAVSEAIAPMRLEDVQKARLAFDARKWWAAKLAPRKYSDRVQQEVSGPDGSAVQLQPVPPPMVPREVAAAVRRLIANSELAIGLPAGTGSDVERIKAIVATGEPLPPDLYESLYRGNT